MYTNIARDMNGVVGGFVFCRGQCSLALFAVGREYYYLFGGGMLGYIGLNLMERFVAFRGDNLDCRG